MIIYSFKKGFSLEQLDGYISKANDTVYNAIIQEASEEINEIHNIITNLQNEQLSESQNQISSGKML